MEGILYIAGIWFGLWLIAKLFSWIGSLIENHKEKIRDKVLYDYRQHTDIEGEINTYKEKLQTINYEREEGFLEKYYKAYNVKLVGEIGNYLGHCPDCQQGTLVARTGKHGKFIGCTNYPKCRHTENVKNARIGYKAAVKDQIMSDIQKAYS